MWEEAGEAEGQPESSSGPGESQLNGLLERKLADDTAGVTRADLFSLQVQMRAEVKAVDERLTRRLEDVWRKLEAHIGVCGARTLPVLPQAPQLPLTLPIPHQPLPRGPSPSNAPDHNHNHNHNHGRAAAFAHAQAQAHAQREGLGQEDSWGASLVDAAKVSPFSGNDSATSDASSANSSGSVPLGSSPLPPSALPPLGIRPQRRSQSREAPKPLVLSDYAKYAGDGTDPLVFAPEEEDERWQKMREAGTAPQLPTSYCWSLLRGRLGVEGLVHPSLTKSEACPPNSSLKDLLRRQSNVAPSSPSCPCPAR